MPEVDIVLNNRSYPVVCGEGEEARVQEVAAFIDARISQVKETAPHAEDSHLLALVGLILGDELLDAKAAAQEATRSAASSNGHLAADDNAVAEAIGALADRVEALVGRVDRA